MARAQEIPPGKLIVSVIYSSMDALADSLTALEKRFGRVECETVEITTSEAADHREEMGENLLRRFFSFEREVDRHVLPLLKSVCRKIEGQFADKVDDCLFRTVNLDPGIITPANLIMASYKEFNHRVYLEDGVFAELALIHARGRFVRLPWTSPDFYNEEAIDFFERVRSGFKLLETTQESLSL